MILEIWQARGCQIGIPCQFELNLQTSPVRFGLLPALDAEGPFRNCFLDRVDVQIEATRNMEYEGGTKVNQQIKDTHFANLLLRGCMAVVQAKAIVKEALTSLNTELQCTPLVHTRRKFEVVGERS